MAEADEELHLRRLLYYYDSYYCYSIIWQFGLFWMYVFRWERMVEVAVAEVGDDNPAPTCQRHRRRRGSSDRMTR